MKIRIIIQNLFAAAAILTLVSCEAMDDNYKDYLDNRVYSPKVGSLIAVTDSAMVTLHWVNPMGSVAEKIFITYGDDNLTLDEMVDSVVISDLEVKGYSFSVYTMDKFENLSVPEEVFAFPDGN